MLQKSNKKSIKYKKGYTLSETLIAMVIAGVIFTVAFGTMVADYNKNQTTVRLEKMYSTFSQALNPASMNNGAVDSWHIADGTSADSSYAFFEEYLKPYLILSRDCKNSTEGTCDFNFKELNGTENSLNSAWTRFYLNDGTFVALQTNGNDKYKVVYFYFDTNGKKRLNVVARDIFIYELWIQNDTNPSYVGQFLPYGHQYSREELISRDNPNNCNSGSNGNYCAALIMKDGWRIIEGYPWAQARYNVN